MTSNTAQEFQRNIGDEARFLATCDGGDPGSPNNPSIWLLGIEPGWSMTDEANAIEPSPEADERMRRYSVDLQMEWPFNRNAFKLLTAIEGGSPRDYHQFAERAQPFVLDSRGYMKGNLYPVPFNNVGSWDADAIRTTGFSTKEEYREWVRAVRFPILKSWIDQCRPRLLIGSGLTHLADFLEIAGADEVPHSFQFEVNGHTKRVHIGKNGIVPVVVIPHLSGGIHSLNSYQAIEQTAKIIMAELGI